jgi:hypothetical protein
MDSKKADAELRAELAADKRRSLSGSTYVSAMLREDTDKYPWRDGLRRIPAVSDPGMCEHGITICSQWSCLESWAIDWRLYLNRTGAGRRIAAEAGWNPLQDIPASETHRVPDPKDQHH